MKKILILANSEKGLYNFRRELISNLLKEGNKVYISVPTGEKAKILSDMGCVFKETSVDRRGKNPIKDIKLLLKYRNLIKEINPDVVLTYTIKPNIYGGIVSRYFRIPYIANITGLGTAVEREGILSKLLKATYKIALKNARCVFCQNQSNLDFMRKQNIARSKLKLLPGSGVNLERFKLKEYPTESITKFLFIGRILKEKGIEEYIKVAKNIRVRYKEVEFGIIGRCDEEKYKEQFKELERNDIIKYYGEQNDVKPFIEEASCIIHPTFYPEGMSNVLLEASAVGRPVITTDKPGCREIVENTKTGFLIKEKDTKDLIEKVEEFLKLTKGERKEMGLRAREKVEKEFDRNIVIKKYMDEIKR